ncbi:MAG: Gfo/Idh/MocA family oxidoreductase [Desulfobacteraceae bacterium]
MKRIRVAVIGVGYLGNFHVEKYAHMKNVQLVGVVDCNWERAKEVAQMHNTRAFKDHRQLIDQVDAVSIAVPTCYHHAISKDFLSNNVDVLIEKPITTSLTEADELVQLAEQNHLIIQVGHLERFNPVVLALEDKLTVPRFIESHRLSTFKERGTDVSVVLDLMIHDIDIILNLVRSKLTQIHAAGIPVITDQVDIANARLSFANGCVANVTASRISTKNERKIRLFQQDAYISVDFANHEIDIIRKDSKQKDTIIPGMQLNHLSYTHGDALDDELKAFIKAVQHRTPAAVTGQMGRDALKIALSIMEQIQVNSIKLFQQEVQAV